MEDFILSNAERKAIFKALCEEKKLTFNKIAAITSLRSNKLSYQLNLMVERDFLVHTDGTYSLSLEAQRLIPYFSQIFKKEVGVLPVVLGMVINKDKILLLKRKKMPYKDHWGLIGGKQINGETIPKTIEREVLEESTIRARFSRVNGVLYERLRESGQFKHSFLFIVTTLRAESLAAKEQLEGQVKWFALEDVLSGKVERLIPSDMLIIKNYLKKKMEIEHIVMDEAQETLVLQ